jgi:hypothetical protein
MGPLPPLPDRPSRNLKNDWRAIFAAIVIVVAVACAGLGLAAFLDLLPKPR